MDEEQIKTAERHTREEGYIHRALVALDIFLNVITGGHEDETISSRVRRISDENNHWSWSPFVVLAKMLNFFLDMLQKNHGLHAAAGDLERAEEVEKIEKKELNIEKK